MSSPINPIVALHNSLFDRLEKLTGAWALPTLARVIFVGVLFVYYWKSGLTKLGDGVMGLFLPSDGAYVQIFPHAMEAAGYNSSALGVGHWIVALAGTWSEFILPVAIALGLFTRLAALGMIGFVTVQSLTDIYGHGLGSKDIGAWFDNNPSATIMDERAFWVFLLLVLVLRGAGPLSLDRVIRAR